MGVLAWIVIGFLAGWIAAKLTNAPHGLFRNIIVGLIGALVGGYLFEKLNVVAVQDFGGKFDHGDDRRRDVPADLAGDPATVIPGTIAALALRRGHGPRK